MNEELKNKFDKMCKYFGMTEAEFNDIVFHAMEKQSKPNSEEPLYNTNDRLFDADLNKQWMGQQKERKLICEFEGHKYYEGDGTYYFNKDSFEITNGKIGVGDNENYLVEWDRFSKVYPTAALRDAALEEYKRSKEQPEYVECIDSTESLTLCTGYIYKLKGSDRTGYEIYVTYEENHSRWYDKVRFKPSTIEAYTRQELLEIAKREYPKGTRFKSADQLDGEYISDGDIRFGETFKDCIFSYLPETPERMNPDACIYNAHTKQWAEIIPTPVIDFNYCLKEYKEKHACKYGLTIRDVVVKAATSGWATDMEEKMVSIAREIVVSTVLNGEAKEKTWFIGYQTDINELLVHQAFHVCGPVCGYASESIAKQAIEILTPDTIKRARV